MVLELLLIRRSVSCLPRTSDGRRHHRGLVPTALVTDAYKSLHVFWNACFPGFILKSISSAVSPDTLAQGFLLLPLQETSTKLFRFPECLLRCQDAGLCVASGALRGLYTASGGRRGVLDMLLPLQK